MEDKDVYFAERLYRFQVNGKTKRVMVHAHVFETRWQQDDKTPVFIAGWFVHSDSLLDGTNHYYDKKSAVAMADEKFKEGCALVESLGGKAYEDVRVNTKIQQPA